MEKSTAPSIPKKGLRNTSILCDCGRPSAKRPEERSGAPALTDGCERCLLLEQNQGAENRKEVYKTRLLQSRNARQSEQRERRLNPLDGSSRIIIRACNEFFKRRGLPPEPVSASCIEF
jgi:hypothetical protein